MNKEFLVSHDSFFRESLKYIEVARAFLSAYLPKPLLENIQLDTLKIEPTSYIDKEHRELLSDILYSVQIDQQLGYIYCLVEHQSTPQELMPFRILKYLCGIFDSHLKQQKGDKKKLPIVVPLVVYNGKRTPYPFTTDLLECFAQPNLAKDFMFKPFKLIDLTVLPDNELKQHQQAAVMELLAKHIRVRDLLPLLTQVAEAGFFRGLRHLGSGEYLEFTLKYILMKGESSDIKQTIRLLTQSLPEDEEKIMTIAEGLKKEAVLKVAHQLLMMAQLDKRSIAKATGLSIKEINQLVPKKK